MKGVFTSLNRNSYIKDVCLVYILSVNQKYRLFCQLANGVSKIPWGWMQEVFSLCLSSSPHPSPTVFSFDAVGERPATKHIQISWTDYRKWKNCNVSKPNSYFLKIPIESSISNTTLCKPHEVPNLVPRVLQERTSTEENRFLRPYLCVLSEGK